MPDHRDLPDREPTVVVHHAGTSVEAMVIRGLLESAGIRSPEASGGDPFPMREPPSGMAGVDIEVLQSQADEARRIIADYLASGDNIVIEESSEDDSSQSGDR
jgi:hypothetical protein